MMNPTDHALIYNLACKFAVLPLHLGMLFTSTGNFQLAALIGCFIVVANLGLSAYALKLIAQGYQDIAKRYKTFINVLDALIIISPSIYLWGLLNVYIT